METVIIIRQLIPPSRPSESNNRTFNFPHFQPYHFISLATKSTTIKFHSFICAADSNGNSSDEQNQEGKKGVSSGGGKENENGLPRLNMKWVDLLVNPDPDNVVAVGLTGVLAWASVQVLWQLFVISIAIVLAALKVKGKGVRKLRQPYPLTCLLLKRVDLLLVSILVLIKKSFSTLTTSHQPQLVKSLSIKAHPPNSDHSTITEEGLVEVMVSGVGKS